MSHESQQHTFKANIVHVVASIKDLERDLARETRCAVELHDGYNAFEDLAPNDSIEWHIGQEPENSNAKAAIPESLFDVLNEWPRDVSACDARIR